MKFLTLFITTVLLSATTKAEKPNIVLFYIDDMGWGEIGPFGHPENKTPSLDRMAKEGLRLTQYYTSNTACSPSRAAMLTGTHARRIEMDGTVHFPGDPWGMNPSEVTIADMLKEVGYATGCFGKWHLGDQPEVLPMGNGFDFYYGIPYSNDMWPGNTRGHRNTKEPYTPLPLILGSDPVAYVADAHDQALLAETFTDKAIDWIEENQKKPFFCYVPHAYVHFPRYARRQHFDRAETNVHRSTTEEVDDSVGRILDTLRELGLEENTLVIFTSDNGGVASQLAMGGLRGNKGGPKYEGHQREPFVAWWPGTIPAGSESSEFMMSIDFLPSLAKLVGGTVPTDRKIDGKDALDVLLGKKGAKSPHEIIYYEDMGVRRGDWKLVRNGRDAKLELYDLSKDLGETKNLAESHPELTQELLALCIAHGEEVVDPEHFRPRFEFQRETKPRIPYKHDLPNVRTYAGKVTEETLNVIGESVPEGSAGGGKQVGTIDKKGSKGKSTKPGPPQAYEAAPGDVLIAGFEGENYGEWTVTGTAFGDRPARAGTHRNRIAGYQGEGLINTYLNGDKSTGTLTSPAFTISAKHLKFLIGGGKHEGQTGLQLLIGGETVRSATGYSQKDNTGHEIMAWQSWDVSDFKGKQASLVIIDQHEGGWGHINVDHILQSNQPAANTPPPVAAKKKKAPPAGVPLETEIVIKGDHLIVPVANAGRGQRARLGIFDGETMVQNFNVTLPSPGEPHWLAAYPIAPFGLEGKTVTIKPDGKSPFSEAFKATFEDIRSGSAADGLADDDYELPYRNQFHASTRRGWNNDPNGMVYHDGKYHLYYQHNPFGIGWGNMHWGHWESADLIHWEEKPIALYQKTAGDMAFSGGGFVDFNNSAGLGKNTLFVAFTSTGRGECLAYSVDGGVSFTELEENPVVEHRGRDPKIIWYAPEQKWVMAVYNTAICAETEALPPAEGSDKKFQFANVAFYDSKDLRQWTRTGAFTDPDRRAVHECPELFELPVEGQSGESRWILYGAQNRYFIGDFDGKTFTKESGPHPSLHGPFYAAQTFSDVPDGRRIQVGWIRTATYVQQFPDQIVNQAMSLPHEMTLHETDEGLRVRFRPAREVEDLRGEVLAKGKDLTAARANKLLQKCEGELTEVVIEFAAAGPRELVLNGIDASFEGRSARIFTDRTFNEVYVDDGDTYEVRLRPAANFESTETKLTAGKNLKIKSLTAYRLNSIWK